MKKAVLLLMGVLLFHTSGTLAQSSVARPDKCGVQHLHEVMIAKDPSWAQKLQDQKNSLETNGKYYLQYQSEKAAERTTGTPSTISPVPVIFHIVVDSAQFIALGGTAGIIQRCNSQIAVLNADFNKQNYDSTLIPSSWKPLYGDVGIHFGLARVDPSGSSSPGYEIKIIPGSTLTDGGFSNEDEAFPEAKTAGTGLPAWNITKYYNVWCINFTGSATGLLGLTVPLSQTSFYPANTEGVCMLYQVLGSVGEGGTPPTGTGRWYTSPNNYSLGRTLTHETGHFFEIWHTWGDDGGLCPWNGGSDDGLSDTPPEADAVYGNPIYTIGGGTYNDACMDDGSTNKQSIGIACLSYMDYSDDDAMHLFTPMQAAAMASMVLVPPSTTLGPTGTGMVGENYSLTQNSELLAVAPNPTEQSSSLSVYPNPTTGTINISLNSSAEVLDQIIVINVLGQEIMTINGQNKDYYSIDLSGMSKGIYFVKCNFASGSVTRKILLQ